MERIIKSHLLLNQLVAELVEGANNALERLGHIRKVGNAAADNQNLRAERGRRATAQQQRQQCLRVLERQRFGRVA